MYVEIFPVIDNHINNKNKVHALIWTSIQRDVFGLAVHPDYPCSIFCIQIILFLWIICQSNGGDATTDTAAIGGG